MNERRGDVARGSAAAVAQRRGRSSNETAQRDGAATATRLIAVGSHDDEEVRVAELPEKLQEQIRVALLLQHAGLFQRRTVDV